MNACTTTAKIMSRKRNRYGSEEYYGNDPNIQKLQTDDQNRKQNHSEIEKRRRDKMNNYISELSSLIPMCNAMSRKLDKLTVLRMAIQHMRTLRGPISSYTESDYKPSFLSNEELKHLILQTTEGFLFVVSCDRGRILFVSDSVSRCLYYSQGDLLGQSLFDILHPKDIPNVKEQLSSLDLSSKEYFADTKSKVPLKSEMPLNQSGLCPGSRRSFFCRMRCKSLKPVKEEGDDSDIFKRKKPATLDCKYSVIHCTGYLKSWTSTKFNLDDGERDGNDSCNNLSCLVAVGQVQKSVFNPDAKEEVELRPAEFTSRHAADSKFLFVDQRATLILGYMPQELVGTSCYAYFHQDDVAHLSETHKHVLQTNEGVMTRVYRFRSKSGNFVHLQSKWKTFHNPWTKEFEYIVSVNCVVSEPTSELRKGSGNTVEETLHGDSSCLDTVMENVPSSRSVSEAQHFTEMTIGNRQQMSEDVPEMLDIADSSSNHAQFSSCDKGSIPNQTMLDPDPKEDCDNLSTRHSLSTPQHASDSAVHSGDCSSSQATDQPAQCDTTQQGVSPVCNENNLGNLDSFMGREMLQAPYQNSEGSDEAAMAVIMSFLEADAGLGGPIDFGGLPWPPP